jgi:histidinol phosphatase-like enzyme (inositol monophosphatase family)
LFRAAIAVEAKPDSSPVTAADREAEAAMRAAISAAYPDHGMIGEEFPPVRAQARWLWTLDPIDGTKAFVTGRPGFGTLIGLVREGRPVLGLIDVTVPGERWLAVEGRGTNLDGRPVQARPCPDLAGASLFASSPDMFAGQDAAAFDCLRAAVGRPHYGAECQAYGLLSSGHIDLVVEATLGPDDFMPMVPVVEGAGGVISDWRGAPLGLGSDGRVVAAGDARVHRQALALLDDSQ